MSRMIPVILLALLLCGCGSPSQEAPDVPTSTAEEPTTAPTAVPTAAPEPTATPSPTTAPTRTPTSTTTLTPEPTATLTSAPSPPLPTATPAAAIAIPVPPLMQVDTPSHTVCAENCDFTSLQAAIDDEATTDGAIIACVDPVHTEAGIVISKDVTIRGQGGGESILQASEAAGEATDRVLVIKKGATVTLQGMTIRHGNAAAPDDQGGGIYNYGTLTIFDCTISNNKANGGGGIANSGTLTLVDSTVSSNTAHGNAALGDECGNGGGIKCGNGTLTLLNSTVSDNQAGTKGRNRGGGFFVGCGCSATLINSTISGNRTIHKSGRTFTGGQGLGGGIHVMGTLQMVHCTISDNRSSGEGGGVFVRGTLHYANTIIANSSGRGDQCLLADSGATLGVNTNNLVEGGGSCRPDISDDPMLGPLADNGGATWTHALLTGSPAIDAVPESDCVLGADQRGQTREGAFGGDPRSCDIGAFEVQP